MAAVVFAPLSLHAEETQSEKAYKIEIKDNLISLDAQDAEIADILKEIEKSTEIKTVIEESLIGKKITKNFWKKSLKNALMEILSNYYYYFTYSIDPNDSNKKKLIEIRAVGDFFPGGEIFPITHLAARAQIDISWTDDANKGLVFSIERKTERNGTYVEIAKVVENYTSFTDYDVVENKTYYYRVTACNNGCRLRSSHSIEIAARPNKITVSPIAGPTLLKSFPMLSALEIGKGFAYIYYNPKISKVLNLNAEIADVGQVVRAIETKINPANSDIYTIDFDPGPSDDPQFIISLKVKDQLVRVGDVSGYNLAVPGDGYIYVSGLTNQFFNMRRKYFLQKGELKEVVQPFYYVGLKTTNTKALDLYTDAPYFEKIANLPENTEIEVLVARKMSAEHGSYDYLIRTSFGLLGWVHLSGTYQLDSPVLKGIYYHGD